MRSTGISLAGESSASNTIASTIKVLIYTVTELDMSSLI